MDPRLIEMARESEAKVLRQIIEIVGRNHKSIVPSEVTGFMAMVGDRYSGELMVVGRAVNGWDVPGRLPSSLTSSQIIEKFLTEIVSSATKRSAKGCPMCWVTDPVRPNDYNSRRSAFWRVIRRVIGELKIADTDDDTWPSYLLWSNLYKIAPKEGGNPTGFLRRIQFDTCALLFGKELEIFKPKRVLFLTGMGWAKPFVHLLMPAVAVLGDHYVEATGKYGTEEVLPTVVVVAAHPGRKPEDAWVQEVVTAFRLG
jgi:hypothetical protein